MNTQSMERASLGLLILTLAACSDSSGKAPDAVGSGGEPGAGGSQQLSTGGSVTGAGGDSTASAGGSPTTGSGGGAGTPAGGAPPGGNTVPLTVDATGWVDKGGNTVGIQGSWYAYDDCTNSPGSCTMNHTPASGAFANTDGKMCTKGTTVAVKAEADFTKQWGAGIALDLNGSGGTDTMKLPFDAQAAHVTGFFTSVAVGDNSHFKNGKVGANTVSLSEVAQGSWVKTKTPLDTTQLLAIQFQIPTVMSKAVDFDFCVEGLAAMTN